jgi:hypothetical protein
MTRTELEINQQDMLRLLVFEQGTTLTLAVEMLLRCLLAKTNEQLPTACSQPAPENGLP